MLSNCLSPLNPRHNSSHRQANSRHGEVKVHLPHGTLLEEAPARMRRQAYIFTRFFLLGLTSFGGPAAHIGYFRQVFVQELQWIDDHRFANLIALCQFLPGPASSQLGFAIGLQKGGLIGGLAAFLGFTLPSFVLMIGLATTGNWLAGNGWLQGIVHGLKLLAVVVVADACLGMYRSFCSDIPRASIAITVAIVLLLAGGVYTQLLVLVIAGAVGAWLLKGVHAVDPGGSPPSRRPRIVPLVLFAILLALTFLPEAPRLVALAGKFFLAGSMVFGGGHVVLPVLQSLVAETLTQDTFLTGYAAAQAVPGPMFTFASFLGAKLLDESPVIGALIATIAIFLPGFLLIFAFEERWQAHTQQKTIAGAAAGINAAVVGLLIAVLYDPVVLSAIGSRMDVALVIAGFFALRVVRINVALLVVVFLLAGLASRW